MLLDTCPLHSARLDDNQTGCLAPIPRGPRKGQAMPRSARVIVPNVPHHVVQRGHNRLSIFAEPADFNYYLQTLREWKRTLGVKVYGYCLMTNHVHLILEPSDDAHVIGKLMRRLAGRQTRYVNRLEGRTGSLWEGRYKASPIQTERYLLACSRYVELNPVRARIVATPEQYAWSSFRHKVGTTGIGWLDEDPCFRALGDRHPERARRYAAYVRRVVSAEEEKLIRQAVRRNQLTGDERFIDEIAERVGRRIELRGRGRPRKLT